MMAAALRAAFVGGFDYGIGRGALPAGSSSVPAQEAWDAGTDAARALTTAGTLDRTTLRSRRERMAENSFLTWMEEREES